jgi:flagellar FliL protein
MSSAPEASAEADAEGGDGASAGGKKKLILIALPVLLGAAGAGLWFSGIIPRLLGKGDHAAAEAQADPNGRSSAPAAENAGVPVFVELPEIVANLNGGARKTVYVKLKARLEVSSIADSARVQAAMPRLLDLFQTYIREMRPDELRGSGGTYRLREELAARAQIAAAPARIRDVLFVEILIQ